MQSDWRWCSKCQGLAYSRLQPSVCPAGGSHDHSQSANYTLPIDDPSARGQPDWRWCRKCQGLAFSLMQPSVCPAGGSHDHSQSANYTLAIDDPSAPGQSDWRWCRKCQGLAFSLNQPSVCPAGRSHDHSGSGNYTLAFESAANSEGGFAKPYSIIKPASGEPASPEAASAPTTSWTTQDVIDPRIDVEAQYSLMRMFESGGDDAVDASAILSAIKSEILAGTYQQNQKKPALRAQKLGIGWWELFKGQPTERLAFCWKEPVESPPMIVMRKDVKSTREGLDPALRDAWRECGLPSSPPRPYDRTRPPHSTRPPSQGAFGSLRVKTVTEDRNPISGIDVYIYVAGQPAQRDARRSSDDGFADFDNLDVGNYDIRVYGHAGSDGRPKYFPVYRQVTVEANDIKVVVVTLARQGYSEPPVDLELKTIQEAYLRYTILGPPEVEEKWKRSSSFGTVEWRRVSITQRWVPKNASVKQTCDRSGKLPRRYSGLKGGLLKMNAEQIVIDYTFDPPPDDPNGTYGNMPATAEDVEKLWESGQDATPPC